MPHGIANEMTDGTHRTAARGEWADIGKFKVPTLRLLTARAPYFHDGSAPTLGAVVAYYDQRFDLKLSSQEQADLVAFMSAL